MRIISFAWTTAALLAGQKTVTRRDWKDRWAASWHAGDLAAVYERQPRYGGRQVATIRLTQDPYKQSTRDAPEDDFEAEGFAYLAERGIKVDGLRPEVLWRAWQLQPQMLWVVRFELMRTLGGMP